MENNNNKECEFCRECKSDVKLVINPYNDCHKLFLCEQCYEYACDNVTYY